MLKLQIFDIVRRRFLQCSRFVLHDLTSRRWSRLGNIRLRKGR